MDRRAIFTRTIGGLTPADDNAKASIAGVKIGDMVAVRVDRPRNIKHMALYWAMCDKIAEAVDASSDSISDVLKIKTGHVTVVKTASGVYEFPRSISFAAMDQAAFSTFFERCCRVISAEWLPHLSEKEVYNELANMLGITEPLE